jgi:MFS family permease
MLLPTLGTSIANVALPTLMTSFDASTRQVQWVVIAYLLAVTTLVVAAGRIGDVFGRRRVLLAGIGVFIAASAAGVFASDLWHLILVRGVQGVGAAVVMALSVALVGDAVPAQRAGTAVGLLATVSALGTALGPSLGGVLIAAGGWQAIFVFLTVAGAAALMLGRHFFPTDRPASPSRLSVDYAGIALLALTLGGFAFAATIEASWFITLSVAVLSLVALTAFVSVEQKVRAPLVPLQLLADRQLRTSLLSLMFVSAIMMATLVVGPVYLSAVLGLAPAEVGLLLTIGPAVAAATGFPAGRLVDRVGHTRVASSGLAGVALGSSFMAVLPEFFGIEGYVASLVIITACYALFQAANNSNVMKRAGEEQRGVTAALLALARNLGLVAGASAMGSIFALGSGGIEDLGLAAGGQAGMRLTFAVAAALACVSLVLVLRVQNSPHRKLLPKPR